MSHPVKELVLAERHENLTVAAILREMYEDLAWSRAKAWVQHGHVSINATQVFDPAQRVRSGQTVSVNPQSRRFRCPPLPEQRILHLDAEIVVIDKPPGLVTAPFKPRGGKNPPKAATEHTHTLIDRTAQALSLRGGHRSKVGRGRHRNLLGIVQRLDKDTSGVMVFARTRAAREALESQFRAHSIQRQYQALTMGSPEDGTISNILVPNRGDGKRGSFRGKGKAPADGRRAITHVQVKETFPGGDALVECHLETGRQHQIRIHLAEQGHPILGEPVYGRAAQSVARAPRPMLHAQVLGFRHPGHGKLMVFVSPLPDDFATLAQSLRTPSDPPSDATK